MMQILVGRAVNDALPPIAVDGMHRLRYLVFRERLHWDIPVADYRERDRYDECNPIFMLARKDKVVVGCCRLLPTTGDYMLKNTFPQLLGGRQAPMAQDIWEISRFAVTKESRSGFGFSTIPATIIRELVHHALANGIRQYVFVTTTGFERLLMRMGIHLDRFAASMQVGIERSVALWMHIDAITVRACNADVGNDASAIPPAVLEAAA